jgi:hypothetical protein
MDTPIHIRLCAWFTRPANMVRAMNRALSSGYNIPIPWMSSNFAVGAQ